MASRKMVVLTDGYLRSFRAKTAHSVIRYRPEEVVAVLDAECAGSTCADVLGYGGPIPVVGTLDEVGQADTLLLGIAPPGGRMPPEWKSLILEAIARGMHVLSGLHDFLRDDPELAAAAEKRGVRLTDVRANDEHDVASFEGLEESCLRIHTVANDCSCGKMTTAIEITDGLQKRGLDSKFVATGQTGIMIEGDGSPIDCVVADFVSGAAEKLVLANQSRDVLLIEGQGSLFHPRYSAVTLGLLHGVRPDGLVLCYDMTRTSVAGMDWPLPPLNDVVAFYESAAQIMHPCRMIGVSVIAPGKSNDEVHAECDRVEQSLGLPASDVFRHGSAKLEEAVLKLGRELGKVPIE